MLDTDSVINLGGNGFTSSQIASTLSNKIQQLILLPTERCNFRCTYCYEDFALGRMSKETQSGIEKFIAARVPDLTSLQLSWFGGEPLVAKDIVLRIAGFAHRLCEAHDVNFSGGLTTNAYFLEKSLLEELLSVRQNFFQITLDGYGDVHDAVRKQAGGKGSFWKIWKNLLDARSVKSHFNIQLRIHVRRDNIDTLPLLMTELGKNFADDERFSLDFEHLRNLGGEGGKSIVLPLNREEMRSIESECRALYSQQTESAHRPAPWPCSTWATDDARHRRSRWLAHRSAAWLSPAGADGGHRVAPLEHRSRSGIIQRSAPADRW